MGVPESVVHPEIGCLKWERTIHPVNMGMQMVIQKLNGRTDGSKDEFNGLVEGNICRKPCCFSLSTIIFHGLS